MAIIWAYDASDIEDPWKKYDPSVPFGNDLEEIVPGFGYSLMVYNETELQVSGTNVDLTYNDFIAELWVGNNLVGPGYTDISLNGIIGKDYDYNEYSVLESGKSYWIFCESSEDDCDDGLDNDCDGAVDSADSECSEVVVGPLYNGDFEDINDLLADGSGWEKFEEPIESCTGGLPTYRCTTDDFPDAISIGGQAYVYSGSTGYCGKAGIVQTVLLPANAKHLQFEASAFKDYWGSSSGVKINDEWIQRFTGPGYQTQTWENQVYQADISNYSGQTVDIKITIEDLSPNWCNMGDHTVSITADNFVVVAEESDSTDYSRFSYDTIVVYGATAAAQDYSYCIGELKARWPGNVVKADIEVTDSDKASKNLILLSSPSVNTLVSELASAGKTKTTSEWESTLQDSYLVQVVDDAFATGKDALIIAGWDYGQSKNACDEALYMQAGSGGLQEELSNYDMFSSNSLIVYGANAIGMDYAYCLGELKALWGEHVVKADIEVTGSDKVSNNMILLGGPAVNALVAELANAEKTPDISYWVSDLQNQYLVQVVENAYADGKDVLIVAGYDTTQSKSGCDYMLGDGAPITEWPPAQSGEPVCGDLACSDGESPHNCAEDCTNYEELFDEERCETWHAPNVFNYHPCGNEKIYNVVPGDTLKISSYADGCDNCVCFHVDYDVYDYVNNVWVKKITVDEPDEKGISKIFDFTPEGNKIKIVGKYKCFHMNIYREKAAPEPECTDSDYGENYYVKGTVVDKQKMKVVDSCKIGFFDESRNFWDYEEVNNCNANTNNEPYSTENPEGSKEERCLLTERICGLDGLNVGYTYYCKNGCIDGACVQGNTPVCGDNICDAEESVTSCPVDCGNCVDSDNGKAYDIKGTVTMDGMNYHDACVVLQQDTTAGYYFMEDGIKYINNEMCSGDGCYIGEAYCDENAEWKFTAHSCSDGCKDGACTVAEGISCTDSDNGKDHYVAGKVYGIDKDGKEYSYTDLCELDPQGSGKIIHKEMYCASLDPMAVPPYFCPNGCANGACLTDVAPDCATHLDLSISPQVYYVGETSGVLTVELHDSEGKEIPNKKFTLLISKDGVDVDNSVVSTDSTGTYTSELGVPDDSAKGFYEFAAIIEEAGCPYLKDTELISVRERKSMKTSTVMLQRGWNLFSAPLQWNAGTESCDGAKCYGPGTNGLKVVRSTCKELDGLKIWHWNSEKKGYFKTLPYAPFGYWTKVKEDCSITFEGNEVILEGLELNAGWNQIGGPTNTVHLSDVIGDCNIVSGPWSYYTSDKKYGLATSLGPGEGYFVKVSERCTFGESKPPGMPIA